MLLPQKNIEREKKRRGNLVKKRMKIKKIKKKLFWRIPPLEFE